MKTARAFLRLIFLVVFTTVIVLTVMAANALLGFSSGWPMRIRRFWARNCLRVMGLRLTVRGEAPAFPCLILANHRSSMDPLLILERVMAFPVSKAEVAQWPILGYGAKASGIVFLQRESMTSRKNTLAAIAETIHKGWPVLLFPEGTTVGTPHTGPLFRGSFTLAVKENLTVLPVAMEYGSDADYWVGKTPFLTHFVECYGQRRVFACAQYGPPLVAEDAESLRQKAQAWLDHQLKALRASRGEWAVK